MNRFILAPGAWEDLDDIERFLGSIPVSAANRIGKKIQQAILRLATHPYQGFSHAEYSELAGEDIRSTVESNYIFYYSASRKPITFLGVIHGKRDVDSVMRARLG
jgi:plasmid stabilization system protein ParE